ncbi:MAG: FAD-dependent oxidoreductase, partial [Gammaproteobacteria bacterium]|nr:FAD-dependent oxidoreductase [Gammaproteobacteria bacterium]
MDYLDFNTLDGTSLKLKAVTVDEFRNKLRGQSIIQGDPEYNESRVIWNGSTDKHPAIMIKCSGSADVIDAVNFAREHGIVVAVRGGGHNVAGNALCDGGMVIDLSKMNSVRVIEKTRRAFVGGGALLGDVDR